MYNEYNPSVEKTHSEKIVKEGKQLKIVSTWKGKKRLSLKCQEFVKYKPKRKLKPRTCVINGKKLTYIPELIKRCGKPVTHVVSWEIDRWYGKKHAEEVYCQIHAEKFAMSLKRGNKDDSGRKLSYEPIEIRKLQESKK